MTSKSTGATDLSGAVTHNATFSPACKPNALKANTVPAGPDGGVTEALMLGGKVGFGAGAGAGAGAGEPGGEPGGSGAVSSRGARRRPKSLIKTRLPSANSGQYSKRARSKYWTICHLPSAASVSSISSLIG